MSRTVKTRSRQKRTADETHAFWVPCHHTLEGFTQETDRARGVDVCALAPLSRLAVQTYNTLYRITLIEPTESRILIQGGRFFGTPSRAYLCGASYGGTLLKTGWVGFGMRLEVLCQGRRIVTSPVVDIDTWDDSDWAGPF